MKNITIYTTTWCADCFRSKALLDRLNVKYINIDIESDEKGMEFVMKINNGNQSVPVILFPDNTTLTEPSDEVVQSKLESLHMIPQV